jgi:hemolysin III
MAAPELLVDRPRLRGRLHQVAAFLSIGGLVWRVADPHTPMAARPAAVYGRAPIALSVPSTSYPLYARPGRAREEMQRLDHSMIYVLIAGTYTPVCLLALSGSVRWELLAIVWTGAHAGVLFTLLAYDRFPHMTFILSLILGWAALLALPVLLARPGLLALAAVGGVLYTAGAILFACNWPGRTARWFG